MPLSNYETQQVLSLANAIKGGEDHKSLAKSLKVHPATIGAFQSVLRKIGVDIPRKNSGIQAMRAELAELRALKASLEAGTQTAPNTLTNGIGRHS